MSPITSSSRKSYLCWSMLLVSVAAVSCYPRSQNIFAARRAADDSRPLMRIQSRADQAEVVTGKFLAPAPERVYKQRVPKSSNFATQTMSASYRVADSSANLPEKIVHGIVGASAAASNQQASHQQQQHQQQSSQGGQGRNNQSIQRTVGAKIQVSDEGLNYPPSKLSADIYGNVAEIVTAPPEAVESDFLLPQSTRFGGHRRRSAGQ